MVKKQSISLKTLIAALAASISIAAIQPSDAMAETTTELVGQESAVESTTEAELSVTSDTDITTTSDMAVVETSTDNPVVTAETPRSESTPIIISSDTKSSPYCIAVGEIVAGSLLAAVGLGMAIPAIVIDEKENSLWNSTARYAVGASGIVAFALGAVAIGVASYELHEIKKNDGSTVSISVAPTFGGAMFNMDF